MTKTNRIRGWGWAQRLNKPLLCAMALAGVLSALPAAPAFAVDAAEVSKLMHNGQLNEAMSKVNTFLAQKPDDAQMRFLKGLILTEQHKSTEAIAVFTKLTEDFPALPEPYNNIAVLYASSGEYEKARAALDMAIRTNPSYATAYENLGDVHAKLASQAYDKALQLDSSNSSTKSKLTLLRSLGGNVKAAPATIIAQAPRQAAPVLPTPPAKPIVTKPTPVAAPTPAPVQVKPETPKPEVKVASNDSVLREEALDMVQGWAHAWSTQDMKAYLSHYASNFDPPGGQSRKAWEQERHARIVGKESISVKIESPHVTINGDTATVKFRQIYTAKKLKADSRKTLTLTRQGNSWKIKQERVGG